MVLFLFLLAIVSGITWLSRKPKFSFLFKYLPVPLWCYFTPMVFHFIGILPGESPVYDFLFKHLLPSIILVLLIGVQTRMLFHLGPILILMMLVGSLGIIIGAPISLLVFRHWLPEHTGIGFATLSGSWTGGSGNMLMLKEILRTPDDIFSAMVVLDTIGTYSWMSLLIAISPLQDKFDRITKARTDILQDVYQRISKMILTPHQIRGKGLKITFWILSAILVGELCISAGSLIPFKSEIFKGGVWGLLLVSFIGIAFSLTRYNKYAPDKLADIGTFFLYVLLATIGVRANLNAIFQYPVLLITGLFWIFIHGLILFIAGFLLRTPMFVMVTASQANIGGVVSTPIVAGTYQPLLAPAGLLLAIFGNIFGTYFGLITAFLCRLVTR